MELTCREFTEFVDDYLSGELAPNRLVHCEAHLSQCPDCVKYYRSYQETLRLGKKAFDEQDEKTAAHLPQELERSILVAVRRLKARTPHS